MNPSTTTISRTEAVRDIADVLADQTGFLIGIPHAMLAHVAPALTDLPTWVAYIDAGTRIDDTPIVLRTNVPAGYRVAGVVTGMFTETTAVVIVPKTVPAAVLNQLLDIAIPLDGLVDVTVLGTRADTPPLLLDATGLVDQAAATELRFRALVNLS